MKQAYRTMDDVWNSPWGSLTSGSDTAPKTDRVLRSTKLEDSIYSDLRVDDSTMDETEDAASRKLRTFPALSRDIFQSFYSLIPKRNNDEDLSAMAQKFNQKILDHVTQGEDYPTIKSVCEGRELPAYESASEFIAQTAGELDSLLSDCGGNKGALNTLDKLQQAERKAQEDLAGMLDRLRQSKERNETLEQAAIAAANQAESKQRQVEAVSKQIDATAVQNKDAIAAVLDRATKAAAEKAEEVRSIVSAWGDGSAAMERNPVNLELLAHVRANPHLKDIARYLGRFREMFAQGKRNAYAYGRGEKYSLELGNCLDRALTSELALLASPLTVPLFLRKYQRRQIKQYQRREPVYKGMGDIICCLDESGSSEGDPAAWGKAVALTLLDIAADGGRKFALIHFAGPGNVRADVFLPGQYTVTDKMASAEVFLNGGTDFVTPMRSAVSLMEDGGFAKADVVFLTDGECEMSGSYVEELREKQAALGFTVTGILLDSEIPGMAFSLEPFCQKIYRTSELMGDEIVRDIVNRRV